MVMRFSITLQFTEFHMIKRTHNQLYRLFDLAQNTRLTQEEYESAKSLYLSQNISHRQAISQILLIKNNNSAFRKVKNGRMYIKLKDKSVKSEKLTLIARINLIHNKLHKIKNPKAIRVNSVKSNHIRKPLPSYISDTKLSSQNDKSSDFPMNNWT